MSGIAPSFVKDITSEGPLTYGAVFTKLLRPVSQKTFGNKASRSMKTMTPCCKRSTYCLVTPNCSPYSSLEAGIKEQYLRVYAVMLDRLPWLKASLNDFIKDGSIMDFVRVVYLRVALHFFTSI